MTYLQLVNEVLALLREDAVTSINESDYSTLISKFVNRAKHKVENSWEWQRLRTTIQVATVSGSYAYSLTGAGKRYKILLDEETNRADVWNDTDDCFLQQAMSTSWMSKMLNDNNVTNNQPNYFDINGYDSNYDPIVNLYPIPDGVARTINFNLYIPQEDLVLTSDVLIVPDQPVILQAYLYALSERGEDNGTYYQETREEARHFLADEITRDSTNLKNRDVWVSV